MSGRPEELFCLLSMIKPPITMVSPLGTASNVCTERVLMGGASVGSEDVPGVLTSASTSIVTSPPTLMCGVTCSNTPVSMYCEVVVITLVVPPTVLLDAIGMLSPTLMVAFWLSSADR